MKRIMKNNIFVFILILLALILAATNYKPGTFLSGWDTLHPEFNFPEYFKRILFGVWQGHQGLGSLSSQAHPSEFPRMLLYYPLSFLLPLSFLRYAYFFITLILAPLGMYFFIKGALLKDDSVRNKIASFGGALFYLFNLGTVQHYFVPLEMFATHFATLPWLYLFLVQFLEYNRKKHILLFAIITFFSASIAHTPTLWFAYFLSLILFLFVYNFLHRKKEIRIRSLIIILITISINAFWIIPNLYFILSSGNQVIVSKINSLFTEEAFANNKLYGTIPDILILKNFLFNWNAYIGNGKFGPLLKVWADHLQQPGVLLVGYGLSIIALLGIVYSVAKKNALSLCLLAIFGLSVFFLLTDNPPFGFIFTFLQNTIPFFKEALRFPFTKFSILLMFTLACYFAFGVKLLLRKTNFYSSLLISLAFLYYMLPAFQGNLISPLMKVNIPSDYFSVFKLLNSKPYGRVATLPIHTFWAWNYYVWGYQGAGFTWFGLKDPVLEREFDRWNPTNEQYYREMSQAIFSQNQDKLSNVLQKYNISYILWDKSIIAPEQGIDNKVLFKKETEKLLNDNLKLQQIAHFGNILIYEVKSKKLQARIINNPISIGPTGVFYDDVAYAKYHDYITYSDSDKNVVSYPFRNMIDNQNRIISENITASIPLSKSLNSRLISSNNNDCPPVNPKDKNNFQKEIVANKSEKFIRYSSSGGSFCEHFSYPTFSRNQGYFLSVNSRSLKGLPLRICIYNYLSKRCDVFTHLPDSKEFKQGLLLIPPIDLSMGFDININNFSVKNSPSINDIRELEVYPFDYNKYMQIESYSPAPANNEKNVLVYSQSYEKGWKAYRIQNSKFKIQNWMNNFFPFLFGKELKEHVLVNNWANGWLLNNYTLDAKRYKLIIIFWPQYLEYLGLIILAGTFIWIILSAVKKQR